MHIPLGRSKYGWDAPEPELKIFTQRHDTSSLDLAIFLTVYIYPSRQSFLPPLLVLIISMLTEIQESILEQHWKLVS